MIFLSAGLRARIKDNRRCVRKYQYRNITVSKKTTYQLHPHLKMAWISFNIPLSAYREKDQGKNIIGIQELWGGGNSIC
jgi:hypothetical protein